MYFCGSELLRICDTHDPMQMHDYATSSLREGEAVRYNGCTYMALRAAIHFCALTNRIDVVRLLIGVWQPVEEARRRNNEDQQSVEAHDAAAAADVSIGTEVAIGGAEDAHQHVPPPDTQKRKRGRPRRRFTRTLRSSSRPTASPMATSSRERAAPATTPPSTACAPAKRAASAPPSPSAEHDAATSAPPETHAHPLARHPYTSSGQYLGRRMLAVHFINTLRKEGWQLADGEELVAALIGVNPGTVRRRVPSRCWSSAGCGSQV
jgi:hypothetical protein